MPTYEDFYYLCINLKQETPKTKTNTSKMKELKLSNILSIPFPKFDELKKTAIANYYYNRCEKQEKLNKDNFEQANENWDKKAGVIDLFESIRKSKDYLNSIIDDIYDKEKTGYIEIIRNRNKNTITLITCKKNTNLQTVFIGYMKD